MTAAADSSAERGILAVDMGNSRVKLGWFPAAADCGSDKPAAGTGLEIARPALAPPAEWTSIRHRDRQTTEWLSDVHRWCDEAIDSPLWRGVIATVHPAAADALESAVARRGGNRLQRIASADVPVTATVAHPQRVGADRLLNVLAAKSMVSSGQAAVVVDMGTAITVDLLDEQGAFAGGAILPGPSLCAEALHAGTAALPDLSANESGDAPAPVGKSTEEAIAAGLYWGAVGATRELCRQMVAACAAAEQVILTGGAASAFEQHLADDAYSLRRMPALTLCGLHLVAQAIDS